MSLYLVYNVLRLERHRSSNYHEGHNTGLSKYYGVEGDVERKHLQGSVGMKTHMHHTAPHLLSLLHPPCMYSAATHTALIDTTALLDTAPGLNYEARATRKRK